MKRYLFVILTFMAISNFCSAQVYNKLTLEDIYQNDIFKINSVWDL